MANNRGVVQDSTVAFGALLFVATNYWWLRVAADATVCIAPFFGIADNWGVG